MIIVAINVVFSILSVIIGVLYFTMLERKIMSYIQIRKGPNKVGVMGLFTPFADAIKLVFKHLKLILKVKELLYYFSPLFTTFFLFLIWVLFPFIGKKKIFYYGYLIFIAIRSVNVYSILCSGWGSKSKYSLLGSIRGLAQIISYEILFVFLSFFPLSLQGRYNFYSFLEYTCFYGLWLLPVIIFWIIRRVAETKRSPFDFSEGERELVSGFNTEYGSLEFAFLFLGEYGRIIFICNLGILLFFSFYFKFFNILLGLMLALSFIWFRSSLPRYRYDLLMELAWCYGLIFVTFITFLILWIPILI